MSDKISVSKKDLMNLYEIAENYLGEYCDHVHIYPNDKYDEKLNDPDFKVILKTIQNADKSLLVFKNKYLHKQSQSPLYNYKRERLPEKPRKPLTITNFRLSGQDEGIVAKATVTTKEKLSIDLNLLKDNGEYKCVIDGFIPLPQDKEIIEKYGEKALTDAVVDSYEKESTIIKLNYPLFDEDKGTSDSITKYSMSDLSDSLWGVAYDIWENLSTKDKAYIMNYFDKNNNQEKIKDLSDFNDFVASDAETILAKEKGIVLPRYVIRFAPAYALEDERAREEITDFDTLDKAKTEFQKYINEDLKNFEEDCKIAGESQAIEAWATDRVNMMEATKEDIKKDIAKNYEIYDREKQEVISNSQLNSLSEDEEDEDER